MVMAYTKPYICMIIFICSSLGGVTADLAFSGQSEVEKIPFEPLEEEVSTLCNELDKEYKKKRDWNLDRVYRIYSTFEFRLPNSSPKEQKYILKAFKDVFKLKPSEEIKAIHMKAVECLSKMNDDGLETLYSLTKAKSLFPKKPTDDSTSKACYEVKTALIEAIGSLKEMNSLKILYKLLESEDENVMFATCEALSCYSDLPVKKKRSIVERIMKRYNKIWSKEAFRYQKNNQDSMSRARGKLKRKYNKYKPFDSALRKLVLCKNGHLFGNKNYEVFAAASVDISPELWLQLFREHKNDKEW